MITPRTTRLLRVPDLKAMHALIGRLACADPAAARDTAAVVPTRGAAEALRRTLEDQQLTGGRGAMLFPDIVTRAELYQRLHEQRPGLPGLLTDLEREVIFRRAALDVRARGTDAPFQLRPGLIAETLAFYDELRRRHRTIDDFHRLMTERLEPSADIDRGAERLLRLTHFLAAAFAEFETRVAATGRLDEHALRSMLTTGDTSSGYAHVIVTVPDQSADPRGLWPADYDMLARIPGLERLDVVATEELLSAGFHERLHGHLPGIEEVRLEGAAPLPVLRAPEAPAGEPAAYWYTCRDREEELVEFVRAGAAGRASLGARTAVVFQRPLPYLYLARQVFADARLPYQALDALPLAAEPIAAALDLVFEFLLSEATRASIVELLASPHWSFACGERPIGRGDVAALDAWLRSRKYLGGAAPERKEPKEPKEPQEPPAAAALAAAAAELRPVAEAASASSQLDALLAFVRRRERQPRSTEWWQGRHHRARAAVLSALEQLRDAHARHDDAPLSVAELAGTIRRWIEGQTFSPRTGSAGVLLLDAPSAAYADVDDVRLVGLVESDWPERTPRNIFYPASLLNDLGWPRESDRLAAARARFRDLLALPRRRLAVSTFTLEDDAIVPASAFLEELETAGLPIERTPPLAPARVFAHEAIARDPVVAGWLDEDARGWLALRMSRSPAAADAFHGAAGVREPGVYAVSAVERYLDCPFKYFAARVLRLPEEQDEESGLTPQEQGQFLHEVFEQFFRDWQQAGGRAITMANVADALALFERVAEARLERLPESDRALERTRLLGSAVAPGLAERAFAFEIEQGCGVVERLLEHELEGEFAFGAADAARRVHIRAKADRIDLLDDGTLRIVDYKLSRAPKPARALQLPVYGVCAEQHLDGRHGRSWTLSRAGYVAFREKQAFTPIGPSSLSFEEAVRAGQERFLAAVEAIERGVFPPKPDEPYRCTWCAYPTVCRKDYVGDE